MSAPRPLPSSRRPGAGVPFQLAETLLEALWFGENDEDRPRDDAAKSLAAQVARIQGLKPFPAAAEKLIRILSDPSFKQADVTAVMESDPSLAARTLAVANSPLFKSRLPCRTIEHATKRLGARNLRDVAIGVSAMSMFHDVRGVGAKLRDHSVGVGAIVRLLADVVIPEESSSLFLAGLLHDVGQLLLLQTEELAYPSDGTEEDMMALEREVLGYDHAVLGGVVMNLWRIPEPADRLIAFHHHPAKAFEQGGSLALMVSLLRAADRIDQVLSHTSELDEEALGRLGEDSGWSYADLSLGDLRQLWPSLIDARGEMLEVLR